MTPLEEILRSEEMVCIKRNQKRAAHIFKALENLTIEEAQLLLGECKDALRRFRVRTGAAASTRRPDTKAEEQKPAVSSQKGENTIKVLKKLPGEPMSNIIIENTLEAMQDAVGGYIETLTIAPNCVVICNEEAHMMDFEYNCIIHGVVLYGPILIVGMDGDKLCDTPMSAKSMMAGFMGG